MWISRGPFAGHERPRGPDASFRFELLERLLHALRRRVQVGAGHLDVRVTECCLTSWSSPPASSTCDPNSWRRSEVPIVDLRLPAGRVPPRIRQASWNGLPNCVAKYMGGSRKLAPSGASLRRSSTFRSVGGIGIRRLRFVLVFSAVSTRTSLAHRAIVAAAVLRHDSPFRAPPRLGPSYTDQPRPTGAPPRLRADDGHAGATWARRSWRRRAL